MKTTIWLALSLCAVAFEALAADAKSPEIRLPSNVPAALAEQIRAYDAAVRAHDANALREIWTDDYVFITPHGKVVTKRERLEHLETRETELDIASVETERALVHRDVVLTVVRIDVKGKYGGEAVHGAHRMIAVWIQESGRWRLASNQLTPIK